VCNQEDIVPYPTTFTVGGGEILTIVTATVEMATVSRMAGVRLKLDG